MAIPLRGCSIWWLLAFLLLLAISQGPRYFQQWRSGIGGKRADSGTLARSLADAVTQYLADYSRQPSPPGAKTGEDCESDSSEAAGIIRILLGKERKRDTQRNSRRINYLEGMRAAKPRNGIRTGEAAGSDRWIGGLILEEDNFELVDAWGAFYRIRLDGDGDGKIRNPDPEDAGEGRPLLDKSALVWSPGKDGRWETWDDNPKSWK